MPRSPESGDSALGFPRRASLAGDQKRRLRTTRGRDCAFPAAFRQDRRLLVGSGTSVASCVREVAVVRLLGLRRDHPGRSRTNQVRRSQLRHGLARAPGSTRVAVAAGDRSSRHGTGRSASGQRTNGWWGLTDPDLALRFTGVWLPRGFVVPNYSLRRIYCEGSRLRLTGMILPLRYSGLRIGYAVWTERIESWS